MFVPMPFLVNGSCRMIENLAMANAFFNEMLNYGSRLDCLWIV